MPIKTDDYTLRFFQKCGGMVDSLSDELIADNELASGTRNVIPSMRGNGNLIDRAGYGTGVSGTTNASGVWPRRIFLGGTGVLYWVEQAPGATNKTVIRNVAGAVLYQSAVHSSNQCGFLTFSDSLDYFWSIGTTNLYLKSSNGGTSWTTWTGPTSGSYSHTLYNNMIWSLNGNTLNWCNPGVALTWPVINGLSFSTNTRSPLTALRAFGTELFMWSRDDLYRLHAYGALDATVTDTITNAGAQDVRLTMSTPLGLGWWNKSKGIGWTFDGKTIVWPMIRKLKATLVDVLSGMSHYTGAFDGYTSCCCSWNEYYQCASFFVLDSAGYAAGKKTSLRIDYFPLEDSFYLQSVNDVTAAHCYSDALDGDVHPMVAKYGLTAKLYGESETSAVDDGVAYTSTIYTKRMAVQSPNTIKQARNALITVNMDAPGTVTHGWLRDNGTVLDRSVALSLAAGTTDTSVGMNTEAKKIQHYLSNSEAQRVEYYSLVEVGSIEKEQ